MYTELAHARMAFKYGKMHSDNLYKSKNNKERCEEENGPSVR